MLQNPLEGVVDDAPAVVQSRMYQNGRGVPQDDAEAAKWYRLVAEQGDTWTQTRLGVMYANGEGVPENDAEAAKWFRLAAEQGDAEAQHNLGVMYDNVSSSIFREWSRRKPRPLELRNRE